MKHLLTIALVVLFALSFTMAQEQTAKQGKTTTVATKGTTTSASTCKAADCSTGSKGCCAAKGSASMKDCPMMKGSAGTSMSKTDTTAAKASEAK